MAKVRPVIGPEPLARRSRVPPGPSNGLEPCICWTLETCERPAQSSAPVAPRRNGDRQCVSSRSSSWRAGPTWCYTLRRSALAKAPGNKRLACSKTCCATCNQKLGTGHLCLLACLGCYQLQCCHQWLRQSGAMDAEPSAFALHGELQSGPRRL